MRLGDLCHISSGGTPSRGNIHFYGGEIPWAKISDIENSTNGILIETEETITEDGLKSIGNRIFSKGTLLFAMYGSIGKVAITGREIATNQAILGIRPRESNQIYLPYLKIWFESNKQKLINKGRGVALQNLSATIIRNLDVPIPAYAEQLHIAKLLNKVENLISQRKQSISLLDEFLKSTYRELFGKYEGKEIHGLNSIASITSGLTKGKNYEGKSTQFLPYMRVANVQDGYLDLSEIKEIEATQDEINRFDLKYGDLLLTEGGDPDKLGRGSIWREEIQNCIFQNHIFRVRVIDKELVNPVFLSYQTGSTYGKKYFFKSAKQTTGIASINSTQLKNFPSFIPPFELQAKFAQIVDKTEALKAQFLSSLQELEKLYGSLSQRAFRGELTSFMQGSQMEITAEENSKYIGEKDAKIQYRICSSSEKAILAGHIIYLTNNEDFGRVKFQKLLHLTSYFCKIDIDSNFTKKAAGPHDGHLIAEIESTLSRFHFYDIKQSNVGNHKVNYTPLSAVNELENIYKSKFEDESGLIDSFLEKFKKSSWEQCEIVSTLYSVWNNRIIRNDDVSDDALKQDFLFWDAQKVKYKDRLDKALQWMRDEGVIPDGWGKLIL